MKHLILVAILTVTLISGQVTAKEVYKNWEYGFKIQLIDTETICSQDAHGVTVAFAPKYCGRTDVNISSSYNGEIATSFPSESERKACGAAKITTTHFYLGKTAWRMCMLRSGPEFMELFYFNRLAHSPSRPELWKFFSIDARLPIIDLKKSRSELASLILRIRVQ